MEYAHMNGLELVKKVRSEGGTFKTPIIMITTEGRKVEVITALKAGVNNYIVKPFNAEVLKKKLDGVKKNNIKNYYEYEPRRNRSLNERSWYWRWCWFRWRNSNVNTQEIEELLSQTEELKRRD